MNKDKTELREFYHRYIGCWEEYPRTGVREQYLGSLDLQNFHAQGDGVLKILDVGCGCGHDAQLLSELSGKAGLSIKGIGIDFCSNAIETIRRKRGELTGNWTFLNADFFDMDPQGLCGEKYDIIICSMVVMHYPDLNEVFNSLSSFLTDNGALLLVTNNPYLISLEYNIPYQDGREYYHEFMVDSGTRKEKVKKYIHSIQSYMDAAKNAGLALDKYKEIYLYGSDTHLYNELDNNKFGFPNFLSMLFKKSSL